MAIRITDPDTDPHPDRDTGKTALAEVCTVLVFLVMAALRCRCGHYIFVLWFLLLSFFFFSSPNLSRRKMDVYHTSTRGMALVRI